MHVLQCSVQNHCVLPSRPNLLQKKPSLQKYISEAINFVIITKALCIQLKQTRERPPPKYKNNCFRELFCNNIGQDGRSLLTFTVLSLQESGKTKTPRTVTLQVKIERGQKSIKTKSAHSSRPCSCLPPAPKFPSTKKQANFHLQCYHLQCFSFARRKGIEYSDRHTNSLEFVQRRTKHKMR